MQADSDSVGSRRRTKKSPVATHQNGSTFSNLCALRMAQLLSHGRSGVQTNQYDRHTYIAEKRRALNKWARHLTRLIGGNPAQSSAPADVSHEKTLPAAERA
jgi:hypothetical protein